MTMLLELLAVGVTFVELVCPNCGERFNVPIAALNLPADTLLSAITGLRAIPCPQCSALSKVVGPEFRSRR